MTFLYHILSTFSVPIVIPLFSLYSLFSQHKRKGLFHHFGLVPLQKNQKAQRKTLWIHALSMGEVVTVTPLIKILRKEDPTLNIVVSVTTDSGYEAAGKLNDLVDGIFFHPLDCWPFCGIALRRIQPDVFLLVDTGFWPGLIDLLFQRKTPMVLFNGRISLRSLRRYRRIKSFVGGIFSKFSMLCMQNEQSVEAVKELGAAPSRVRMIGNPKFDAITLNHKIDRARFRASLGISDHRPVWIAGSTHAGEEVMILEAFLKLKQSIPEFFLVLAPRRIERIPEIQDLMNQKGISFALRSEAGKSSRQPPDALLIDTLGELARLYSIADIAFVGKSLVPPGGGHSLIEPVACGIPVLHGPYIENIRDVAGEFHKHGLAILVEDPADMETRVRDLLKDESRRKELKVQSTTVIRNLQGASKQMVGIIREYLEGPKNPNPE